MTKAKIDLINFMIHGDSLNGIILNDPLKKVYDTMGKPIEKIGDSQVGFLQYKYGLRYGYFEEKIDELAILFNMQEKYSYSIMSNFSEEVIISGKTQIHQFIYLLKSKEIDWKSVNEKKSDKDTFIIEINKMTYAYFDLYSGFLNRIFIARK